MSKAKGQPNNPRSALEEDDERWGAGQVACAWDEESILSETKPMRTQLELHLISQGVLGTNSSLKAIKLKKMMKERRERMKETGGMGGSKGGKVGILDLMAAMNGSEEDDAAAASSSFRPQESLLRSSPQRRGSGRRRSTSIAGVGLSDGLGFTETNQEKPRMTTYLWVAARKKLFPGGQGLKIPKDAYKDATFYWRMIKSYVTVEDCISGYSPDLSFQRNTRYYQAIKMEGGVKPDPPEPFLASADPVYWLASLNDFQQRLREYNRIEWRPKREVPEHIKRHRIFQAKHVKTRALLLGVAEEAVEGTPLARIGAPGKISQRETRNLQRELKDVTTYLDERDHVPPEAREFIHGNDKMRRRLRYGLRIQENLFLPSKVPHLSQFGTLPDTSNAKKHKQSEACAEGSQPRRLVRQASKVELGLSDDWGSSDSGETLPSQQISPQSAALDVWMPITPGRATPSRGVSPTPNRSVIVSATVSQSGSRPQTRVGLSQDSMPRDNHHSAPLTPLASPIRIGSNSSSPRQHTYSTGGTTASLLPQYNPRSVHFSAFEPCSHLPPYASGSPTPFVKSSLPEQLSSVSAGVQSARRLGSAATSRKGDTYSSGSASSTRARFPRADVTSSDWVLPEPLLMEVVDFSFMNIQCVYELLFKVPRNIPADDERHSLAPPSARFNPFEYVEGGEAFEARKRHMIEQEGWTESVEGSPSDAVRVGLVKTELNTIKAKGETYVFPKDGSITFNASLRKDPPGSRGGGAGADQTQPIVTESSISFLLKQDPQSMQERNVEDDLSLNMFARKFLAHPVARVLLRKAIKVTMLPHPAGTVASIEVRPIAHDQQKQLAHLKMLAFPSGVSLHQKLLKTKIVSESTLPANKPPAHNNTNNSPTSTGGGDGLSTNAIVVYVPIDTSGKTNVDLRRVRGCKLLNLSNNNLGGFSSDSSTSFRSVVGAATHKRPSTSKTSVRMGEESTSPPDAHKPNDDEILTEQCRQERDFGGFFFASVFLTQRITRMDTVTSLDLSSNSFVAFPVKFIHYDLPSLTSLSFHKNRVEAFSSIVELATGILRDPFTSATRAALRKEATIADISNVPPNFAILPAVARGGRLYHYNPYGVLTPAPDSYSQLPLSGASSCRVPSLPLDTMLLTEGLAKEIFNPAVTTLAAPPLFLYMLLTTAPNALFPLTLGERDIVADTHSAARKARIKEVIKKVVEVERGDVEGSLPLPPTAASVKPGSTRSIRLQFQSPLQQRLRSLTLHGNPVQSKNVGVYRQKVSFLFPNLVTLDVNPITAAERANVMW